MRVRGTGYVYQAIDLGFAIDLERAERLASLDPIQQTFKRPRRAPEAAQLPRHSLRLSQSGFPVQIGSFRTEGPVDIVLWEFGAVTIVYKIPVDAHLSDLVALSDQLWDHTELIEDARRRAEILLQTIQPAVDKPSLGERMEDYVVFELRLPDREPVSSLWTQHAATTASILRAEPLQLSDQEIAEALSLRCAYLPDEIAIVDWFAALLIGDDMEDERLVLELTVVELLELRTLDEKLDRGVDAAYGVLRRKRTWLESMRVHGIDLAEISQIHADSAVLFEGVDNALKLLGDQYLARLYRIASERFHLPQWDTAIERKMRVLDGIYEKLTTRASSRRFELLEVVIIVLIAVSTVAPFLPNPWTPP